MHKVVTPPTTSPKKQADGMDSTPLLHNIMRIFEYQIIRLIIITGLKCISSYSRPYFVQQKSMRRSQQFWYSLHREQPKMVTTFMYSPWGPGHGCNGLMERCSASLCCYAGLLCWASHQILGSKQLCSFIHSSYRFDINRQEFVKRNFKLWSSWQNKAR